MGENSAIEWTDSTWNPIRGCTRVSEGCRNCYAERTAIRFSGHGRPYEGLVKITNGHPQWTGEVRTVPAHLKDPLSWKEPSRIFVNSMSDLFHEKLPLEEIDKIFAVMALCQQHTFQVLTKRPQRMLEHVQRLSKSIEPLDQAAREMGYTLKWQGRGLVPWPLPNIHLGVSVESAEHKDRIDLLRETPAAVRMLSLEPLLGDLGTVDLHGIHWVIVGGESGPKARPMHPQWARSLRDQCVAAGVPFFFKQWGEWQPQYYAQDGTSYLKISVPAWGHPRAEKAREIIMDAGSQATHDTNMKRVGKKAAGRLLDGKEWNEYPEVKA